MKHQNVDKQPARNATVWHGFTPIWRSNGINTFARTM